MHDHYWNGWSGRRMIRVCEFERIISEYFTPLKVTIVYDHMDVRIDYIKVDNEDGTFQIYGDLSCPSHIELFNNIFNKPNLKPIVGLEIVDFYAWTEEERNSFVESICKKYRIDEDMFWDVIGDIEAFEKASEEVQSAGDEYAHWLFEQSPLSIIHHGETEQTC